MADARIPERYLADKAILRLTDAERSSYFMALTWSVSNRSDGRIERADLPLIPTFTEKAVAGLVRWGCWTQTGDDAWQITDFVRTQTTRSEFEVLDNARRRDREKKQRQRARDKTDVPGDVPGGQSRGTSQARQGKARQGKSQDISEALVNEQTGEIESWPTVPIPTDDEWLSPDAPGSVLAKGAA